MRATLLVERTAADRAALAPILDTRGFPAMSPDSGTETRQCLIRWCLDAAASLLTDGIRLAWRHESSLVCEHDALDAVAEVELHEDPSYVRLDGPMAHDESFRYLSVREPTRYEPKDFSLARRQFL